VQQTKPRLESRVNPVCRYTHILHLACQFTYGTFTLGICPGQIPSVKVPLALRRAVHLRQLTYLYVDRKYTTLRDSGAADTGNDASLNLKSTWLSIFTDRISEGGNAIASVRPSVRLFTLYFRKRLTADLERGSSSWP